MNSFLRFMCCIVLLGLSGCATQQQRVVKTSEVAQCQQLCVQRLDSCKQTCTESCPKCMAAADHKATTNFLEYLHEKRVQGGYITRRLKSYRDPLQCRKVSCNCLSDFITCKQGCTGVIQKQLRPVPYCS